VTPQSQAQTFETTTPARPAAHRWRLQVVHRTRFHYTGPVRSSYNEARLTPENSNRQTTLRSKVEIEPAATAYAYRDYWGSTVTAFDLHSPHSELVVTGTSIVEAGPDLAGHDRVGWSALAAREVREQFGELLAPTPLTTMDDDVVAEVR
jgi:transglutaminase-like putative cysteine protease